MMEATKRPLFVSPCEQKILDVDGENYAYMSFKHCGCRCVPKPVLCRSKRAELIVRAVNAHDDLVAACDNSWGCANNLIENLDDYDILTLDQLRFKMKTTVLMLKALRGTCESALAAAKEPTDAD